MFQIEQSKNNDRFSSQEALLEEVQSSHLFSFQIQLVKKSGLGFTPLPNALYLAQLDHEKITLQNLANSDPVISIPYENIQSFHLSRSLALTPAVQINLKQPILELNHQALDQPLRWIASSPIQKSSQDNRSAEFVELVRLLYKTQDSPLVQQLAHTQQPVVAYFWAKACHPCEEFSSTVDQLQAQWGNQAQFARINMDDELMLPMLYGVNCVPALLVFKEQKVVERIEGAIPAAIVHKVLAKHL